MSENDHGDVTMRDRSPLRDDDEPRRSEKKAGRGGGRGRSTAEKRVYVSNFPYETKWQDIKDLFSKEVGDVAYVNLFKDEKGKSRGCGVIEFSSEESAREAVEKMHRYKLNGRDLVVKEDTDRERDRYGYIITGRSENLNRSQDERRGGGGGGRGMRNEDMSSKFGNTYGLNMQFLESLGINGPLVSRVFVANLDYKVDEKKLREIFRLAGKIISCELHKDKEGNSRGFGTIDYEHAVEAVQAISMFKDQMLYERKMAVRMDSAAMREEQGGLPNKLPIGLKGIGMGLGTNGAPLKNVQSNIGSGGNVSNVNTQSLTNLVRAGALSDVLGGVGAGLGALGGLAASPFGAGIGLAGGLGLGAAGLGVSDLQTNFNLGSDRRVGVGGGGGAGGTDRSDAIIVRNIPPHFTHSNLRERFSDVGEILYAEIRDKGVGLIRFANEKDAMRAVNLLDRTRMDGHSIDVYLY